MTTIYQAFRHQGQQLVYKLLTRLKPKLNSDIKKVSKVLPQPQK